MNTKTIFFQGGMYCDIDGNAVKRDRRNYPYSYDPYVIYRNGNYKEATGIAYSDRLMQWDYDKFNECCMKIWGDVGQIFSSRSGASIEKFLQLYFDNPTTKLLAITEGANVSSGYPYWVFYYKQHKTNIQ